MSTESGFWYIAVDGGKPTGPLAAKQIIESWQAGLFSEQTLCCRQGLSQWVRLADAEPFASLMPGKRQDGALIRFACACGNPIAMGRKFAGRKVKCKQCGAIVQVPAAVDAVETLGAAVASGPSHEGGNGSPAAMGISASRSDILPETTPLQQILAELSKGEGLGLADVAPREVGTAVMGEGDARPKTALAGYKPATEPVCHVCGSRIQKHQKRCTNCLAPLTPEEIAADAATRRKPLVPWLPQLYLSRRIKAYAVAAVLVVASGLFCGFWLYPALRNKAIVQAQVDLAEKHLGSAVDPLNPMKLVRLSWEPALAYQRPSEVPVTGKIEILQAGAAFAAIGQGTLDLAARKVSLRAVLDGRVYTYEAPLPPLLHLAARYGDTRRLKLVLSDSTAGINNADEQGYTALHLAASASGDHLRWVQALVEHGADGTLRDEKGLTPLQMARAAKNGWCAFDLDPRPPHAKPAPPDDPPRED